MGSAGSPCSAGQLPAKNTSHTGLAGKTPLSELGGKLFAEGIEHT